MQTIQNEQSDIRNDSMTLTLNEQMGKRLKEFREKRGCTQLQLALDFNVSEQSIQRYEHGKCAIPLDILTSLHTDFGIDLNFLICGDAPSSNDATNLIIEDLQNLVKKYGYQK